MRWGACKGVGLACALWWGAAAPPLRAQPDADLGDLTVQASAPVGSAVALWPAFRTLPDGGTAVVVKAGREAELEVQREGASLHVRLRGLRVPGGNPQRALDTHYFDTPVTRVQLVRGRGGAVLRVDLRREVEPVIRTERGDDGYFFVVLTFPPGT